MQIPLAKSMYSILGFLIVASDITNCKFAVQKVERD